MIIGSGWKKKDKKGKQYLSISIDVPFLGQESFLLYLNENKQGDNSPDYSVIWIPKRENGTKTKPQQEDDEVPF